VWSSCYNLGQRRRSAHSVPCTASYPCARRSYLASVGDPITSSTFTCVAGGYGVYRILRRSTCRFCIRTPTSSDGACGGQACYKDFA
jgi:hypothetical protein